MEEELKEDVAKPSLSCWFRTLFAGSGAMLAFVFTGMVEAQSAVLLPQLKEADSLIQATPEEATWIDARILISQLFAGNGAMLAFFFTGMVEAQPVVLLHYLKETVSLIKVTLKGATWIASLGVLTSPISAIISGPVVDVIGRKKGLQFFYISIGVGFGVIACATEVWHLYVGRIICAFAVGLEVVAVVYLAEICTKEQRSAIFSVMFTLAATGVLLTYIVGGCLPWNLASGILSVSCFVYLIVQSLAPESPAWLYKVGRYDDTVRSLRRLGRSQAEISREIELLRLSTMEKTEKFKLRVFLKPTVWKPFVILSIYHFLQSASGAYDIMAYTVEFLAALGTSYDPLAASIILAVIRVLVNATAGIYFTGYVSRRFATAFSAFFMTIALLGSSVYEYAYQPLPAGAKPLEWIPIALMTLNICAGAVGVTTLPWLMSGEVFPLQARGAMTGAVFVVGSTFITLFIKVFYVMLEGLQMWGLLFAWAIPAAVTVGFGIWALPETQGKTLYEIEQGFVPKGKRAKNTPVQTENPAV